MGDEKDSGETTDAVLTPAPASIAPRPVSVVPRPVGGGSARMPPPPSSRGITPGSVRPVPPPPPQRNSPATSSVPPPPVAFVAASPSIVPRAPATPPPPPQRQSASLSPSRPVSLPPAQSVTAQLEQRLGAAQLELRKLGSERHTLRARLRREADRLEELESALGAEKDLRRHAAEQHQAAQAGLRSRLAEVEAEKDLELMRSAAELAELRAELAELRAELAELRAKPASVPTALERAAKPVQGLRRIRGIGPAYQRLLEDLDITRVQQIAEWSAADVSSFAKKLRIRAERIFKDDWVGQAKALPPDPED